ncbi:MAG: class I SAM-dependent methyltransferase [Dehalococcoidales bacterium]|jgi:cephalosporin hydroxylase
MIIDNNVEGFVSPIEGSILQIFASKCITGCIVNIGCYKGRSLNYIIDGKKTYSNDPSTIEPTIYAIDIKVQPEVKLLENYGVVCIEGSSYDPIILNKIPDNIELVFIDGDHSFDGCKADLENYWKKLIPGGIMMIHDSYDTNGKICEPEVVKATRKFVKLHMDEFVPDYWYTTPVHKVDSTMVLQKK